MIPAESTSPNGTRQTLVSADWDQALAHWARTLGQYERWLIDGQNEPHRWAMLDQFIREQLASLLNAEHVRCYRPASGGSGVEALTRPGHEDKPADVLRTGIIAHVVASGQSFLRDQQPMGEHLRILAEQDPDCPAWCFPVQRQLKPIGVVAVGRLPVDWSAHESFLEAIARSISLMWARLADHDRAVLASRTDRLTGVLNRTQTIELADRLLQDAAENFEPVAAIAVAAEGLRGLDDAGQWGLRDQIVERIGQTLRRRLRSDDLVGRFTDERFVALMRRLDVSLGRVIAEKLLSDLSEVLSKDALPGTALEIRGGLTACGSQPPQFDALITTAFAAVAEARRRGERLHVVTEPVVAQPVE
jgi:diguanylate cyclase (GGDEF)-like protein